MRVIAFDPFTADSRYREIGAEKAESADDVLAAADFLTLHLPKTPETQGFINSETRWPRPRTACASSTSPAGR